MKGNSFQSKHGLIASPFTVGNIIFRIKGRVQVGVLLEISDKFSNNFNIFSYMILHCWWLGSLA